MDLPQSNNLDRPPGAIFMYALAITLLMTTTMPMSDRVLVEHAARCGLDPYLGARFLEIETLAGLPPRLRGMTLAKACFESRGNPRAIGDGGKAVGIVQLWPWAEQFIHDRTDPIASIHVFLGRLVTTVKTVHRYCPGVRDRWKLAWIRINRGPFWRRADRKGEARCSGTSPAGMKRLRKWARLSR